MKARLLTLAALGWAASAMAGDWTKPVLAAADKVEPAADATVYLYNEATGQFLTGANDWGTQASVKDEGLAWVLVQEPLEQDETITAWGLKNQRADKKNQYLFFDGGGSSFIDMGTQNTTFPDCYHWNFAKQDDGTYTIQIVEQCAHYAEGAYFAWDGALKDDGTNDGIVMPGLDPTSYIEDGTPYGMYWSFITPEAYDKYNAKFKLYDMLNKAEEIGVATDEALAVYTKADATMEEITAAYDALHYNVSMANIGDRLDGASASNPVDATFLFENNDFEAGNINGWEVYAEDVTNTGYQGANYKNGDVTINKFIEMWKNGGPLKNGYIRQQAAFLPAGHYRLEADIIATRQYKSPAKENTGVQLFITVGENTYSCDVATDNNLPEHFVLDCEVASAGAALFGMRFVDTDANWVAADNFHMTYFGAVTNQKFFDMQMAMEDVKPYKENIQDEDDKYYISAAVAEALTALYEKAEGLDASSSDEELEAVTAELVAMFETVKADKAAYDKLRALFALVTENSDKYGDINVVGEKLGEMFEAIEAHLDEGDIDVEGIEALQAEYDRIMSEDLAANLVPRTELTSMLVNPNFDVDGHGWEGSPVVSYGCAEKYETTFNVYQDLTGLPTGTYEVRLHGYVRQGDRQPAYNNYIAGDEVRAFIYGTSGGMTIKTPFRNVFEAMDSQEHFSDGSWMTDSQITGEDGNIYYIPNSMAGFDAWQKDLPEQFATSAQIFVSDGNLRIGAMSEQFGPNNGGNEQDWCIFDTFQLIYVSDQLSESLLKDAVQKEIDNLMQKKDDVLFEQPMPADICNTIDALQTKLDAVSSVEEIAELSNEVADLVKEFNSVAGEAKALLNKYGYYSDLALELETSDPDGFKGWLDEHFNTFGPGATDWATVEEMRADGETMAKGWIKFVTADAATATAENPVDVSEAIYNRGFSIANVNSNEGWNNPGTADWSEMEVYNSKCDVNQEIEGLPAGFYELQVQGFYRMGFADAAAKNDSTIAFAQLYATNGTSTWSTPMQGIFTSAQTESVYATGEITQDVQVGEETFTYYIPNSMECARFYFDALSTGIDEENNGYYMGNKVAFELKENETLKLGIRKDSVIDGDWTIFDNFQLFYLGTTAPDAISTATAGKAVDQKYFTVGGVQLARPQKGVNIVTTTLSDGSKVTTKVLVK